MRIVDSLFRNNLAKKKYGLKVEQFDEGEGILRLQHVTFQNNLVDLLDDGVTLVEVGAP